jgi:pimeloyl-ACP methyl ester carboxylesterase
MATAIPDRYFLQFNMFFPYYGENKELNDEVRRSADDSFIQLPDGITHYELGGAETGKPVVLIHGFSVPYFIYDPTFEFLVKSGFRVLRYDLFGRGFSDRPHTKYNLDLFVTQLADLLDALDIIQPVCLIGLSMGGPITAAYIVRFPEHVDRIVLIGPSGAKPITFSPVLKLAKLPLLAEIVLRLAGNEGLLKVAASDFYDPIWVEHFLPEYEDQMQYKGFKRALLSTIRNGMLGSFIEIYKELGKMDKMILLVWGRNDSTAPFEHSDTLRTALPQAKFYVVENCGHIPHYEKADQVNPILLKFLRHE